MITLTFLELSFRFGKLLLSSYCCNLQNNFLLNVTDEVSRAYKGLKQNDMGPQPDLRYEAIVLWFRLRINLVVRYLTYKISKKSERSLGPKPM